MSTVESLTTTIKDLKKDRDKRIQRLKELIKDIQNRQQTQKGQPPHLY